MSSGESNEKDTNEREELEGTKPTASNGNGESRRLAREKRRREAIFEAAMELFAKSGIDTVTVEQIASRADVAKGTFFSYFPNKEAVLVYFAAAQVDRLQEALQNNQITGTPPERIRQVICFLSSHPLLTPELARGLFISILAMKRPAEFQGPSVYRLQGVILSILQEGQAQGLFRPDLNCEEVSLYLLGQHFLALLAWCSEYWEGTLLSVTEKYINLALEGIAVPSPPSAS